MTTPKRKTSKARRDKRRTHWKASVVQLVECPHCHAMILPHRVCPECGYYEGRQVLVFEEKEEK